MSGRSATTGVGRGAAAAHTAEMQPGDTPSTSPGTPVTWMTWASRVKQPPKAVIPPSTSVKPVCASPRITKDSELKASNKMPSSPHLATEAEMEEVVQKKKRKRKRKSKQTPNREDPGSVKVPNENIVIQEPPKFQDDEEFPDLLSSGAGDRGLKPENRRAPGYNWGRGEAGMEGSFPQTYSGPEHLHRTEGNPREMHIEPSKTKGSGRKSKTPVKLDLGGMLAVLEQKQHVDRVKASAKPVILSVGGGMPVVSRESNSVTKHPQTKQGQGPHNPLDSSAPLVKKGKQREVPKAKKPTSLKKIILKEREQRKQLQASVIIDAALQATEDCPDHAEESTQCQEESEQSPDSPIPNDTEKEMESTGDCTTTLDESPQTAADVSGIISVHQTNSSLPKIHSRRFREYCSQVLSKEVDICVTDLLKELVRFQDRLYLKDPVKAKTKRRLVMGLREVLKHLKLKKLKCVIISPNCEKIQSKGGLDDTLQTIISCACEQNVPFVFALNRKALGRCVNKAVPVSVVGIFSYDGAQDHFHKLYELTMQARQAYVDMIASLQEQQKEGDEDENTENAKEMCQQKPVEVSVESAADEAEEPNYIKVWKKMLEEQYTPYALSLEETLASDMYNFHLS